MAAETVNVLLVEDNELDVEAIIRAFRKNRIANPITVAGDGIEALELLRGTNGKSIERPMVILLDLSMPRMDGLEFLRELRTDDALRSLTVFVLTTSDDEADLRAAHELNVAGYVLKQNVGDHFQELLEMLGVWWRIAKLPADG